MSAGMVSISVRFCVVVSVVVSVVVGVRVVGVIVCWSPLFWGFGLGFGVFFLLGLCG